LEPTYFLKMTDVEIGLKDGGTKKFCRIKDLIIKSGTITVVMEDGDHVFMYSDVKWYMQSNYISDDDELKQYRCTEIIHNRPPITKDNIIDHIVRCGKVLEEQTAPEDYVPLELFGIEKEDSD